jgi:hypothetical protein
MRLQVAPSRYRGLKRPISDLDGERLMDEFLDSALPAEA